jgi:activator of HSP90 ATPase
MSGTQLNFGAQELFIQQLQDEIKRMSGLNQQLQLKLREQHHQLLRHEQHENQAPGQGRKSSSGSERSTAAAKKPSSSSSSASSEESSKNSEHGSMSSNSNQIYSYVHKQSAASINEMEARKENEGLKVKLRTAAKFINNLIQEKEHLIEMSNQLRGELNRIKCKNLELTVHALLFVLNLFF